ncbi:acylphosphatase [Oleomonas cavernae]|uniref:acylphosphatase n=1 Tax=Oleomonas cavernae TaxID=2320859 RepID=A0A418WEA9_9PROT|nr:acylphosphatase [Oleomonas cavernae]RJF88365.1 acylphosphatase [Oleomonas cavernae]
METLRLIIHGRVQGVGYRAWAVGEARRLGLAGWVRNRRDGTVELLASGPAEAVATLVERCRHGPAFADVIRIDQVPADAPAGPGFQQVPTA